MRKKRHDNSMLRHSGLSKKLQKHAKTPNGEPFCLYCNRAYSLRVHLQALINGNLNRLQEEFNSQISKVRITIELLFNEIKKCFAFLDFKNSLKIGLSQVGKIYRVCITD